MSRTPDAPPNEWAALREPPRSVPAEILRRIILHQIGHRHWIGIGLASLLLILGMAHLLTGNQAALAGLIPAALGTVLLIVLLRAISQRAGLLTHVLRDGELAMGRICHIWDRDSGRYQPIESAARDWKKFQNQLQGSQNSGQASSRALASLIARQLQNWPCKVRFTDRQGSPHESIVKLEVDSRLVGGEKEHVIPLLYSKRGSEPTDVQEIPEWLGVNEQGEWLIAAERQSTSVGRSFLRSLVPVALTYLSSAIGITFMPNPLLHGLSQQVPPLLAAVIVLLFTLTHAVVPVFFYRPFFLAAPILEQHAQGVQGAAAKFFFLGFINFHMGFWYGVPMLALGALTGWLNLVGLVHVLLARRGTRHWVFLEYGSTSLALLLFVVCFSRAALFPFGLIVAIFQALMLTVLDWKARDLWVQPSH